MSAASANSASAGAGAGNSDFNARLMRLHADIVAQGVRVENLVERAFEAIFELDRKKAEQVIREDDAVDKVDIQIERACVELLGLGATDSKLIRTILTIVKVNNEWERIADLAAEIAEEVVLIAARPVKLPATLRVMSNSVIGMIRDANAAMRDMDPNLARLVLASADVVDKFKRGVLNEVQEGVGTRIYTVDFASAAWRIAASVDRMAEHTTNICEQVIYVDSGQIVRHLAAGWSAPKPA